MKATTCREQILAAARQIIQSKTKIIYHLRNPQPYKESTIRTHITSRMCGNAPSNHAITYNNLTRIKLGVYNLN